MCLGQKSWTISRRPDSPSKGSHEKSGWIPYANRSQTPGAIVSHDTLPFSIADESFVPVWNIATIKLLTFFEEKYGYEEGTLPNRYAFSTKKTASVSPTLRVAPRPDRVLVRKWVENWKRTGFMQ